jgi:hypothetical protein
MEKGQAEAEEEGVMDMGHERLVAWWLMAGAAVIDRGKDRGAIRCLGA